MNLLIYKHLDYRGEGSGNVPDLPHPRMAVSLSEALPGMAHSFYSGFPHLGQSGWNPLREKSVGQSRCCHNKGVVRVAAVAGLLGGGCDDETQDNTVDTTVLL